MPDKRMIYNMNNRIKMIIKEREGFTLDLGVSDSNLHDFVSENSVGVDITKGGNVDVVCDAEKPSFKNSTFDTVIAGEILEHLEKPFEALKEWHGLLKPNGKIIITTQNMNSLYYITHEITRKDHLYAWSPVLLSQLLKRAGYKIEKAGYIPFRNRILNVFLNKFSWHVFVVGRKR